MDYCKKVSGIRRWRLKAIQLPKKVVSPFKRG